jgi:hypothetical protein
MATLFKRIKTTAAEKDGEKAFITEPILASFPNNMPSNKALNKMKFTVY